MAVLLRSLVSSRVSSSVERSRALAMSGVQFFLSNTSSTTVPHQWSLCHRGGGVRAKIVTVCKCISGALISELKHDFGARDGGIMKCNAGPSQQVADDAIHLADSTRVLCRNAFAGSFH